MGQAAAALAIQGAGGIVRYGAELFASRTMGPEDYGVFSLAFAWLQFVALIATLGFNRSLFRFIPEHRARGELDLVRAFRSFVIATVSGAGLLLGAFMALLLPTIYPAVHFPPLLAIAVATPLLALALLQMDLTRISGRPIAAYVPLVLSFPVCLFAGLYGASSGGRTNVTAGGGIVIVTLSLTLVVATYGVLLWHGSRSASGPLRRPDAQQVRRWVVGTLPLLVVTASLYLVSQASLLLAGNFLSTSQLGAYNLVTRASGTLGFAVSGVAAIFAPRVAEAYHGAGTRDAQEQVRLANRFALVPAVLLGMIWLVLGKWTFLLAGQGRADLVPALAILILGQLVNAAAAIVVFVGVTAGLEREMMITCLVSAVVCIALGAVLIPAFGIMGAAVATSATIAGWNVSLSLIVRRRTGIQCLSL